MTVHRRIALLTGSSLTFLRSPSPKRAVAETGLDPFHGAAAAPDLPQQLREAGAL